MSKAGPRHSRWRRVKKPQEIVTWTKIPKNGKWTKNSHSGPFQQKRDTHTNNNSMRSPNQETVPKRIWVMRTFSAPIFSTMYSNADDHSDFFLTPQNGATTRRRLHNNTWKPIFRYIQCCGYHFSVFDYVAATNQQPRTPSTYFKKCWSCRLPNSMNMTYTSHTSSLHSFTSLSSRWCVNLVPICE